MGFFGRNRSERPTGWRHVGTAVYLAAFMSTWLLEETNLAPSQVLNGGRVVLSLEVLRRFFVDATKNWKVTENIVRLNQEQNKDK